MMIKRLFSTEPTKRLFSEILKDNSGTILALGVIGSGTFGLGLYVNQLRIYEEKLKVYDEKIKVSEEKINAVKMEAKKDTLIAEEKIKASEEKIKTVKIEADKEALQLLYNIFTQEEYKEAKNRLLAQKSNNVNNE